MSKQLNADTQKKRWYVVHVYSGFEAQVQKGLKERVKQAGVEEHFGEVLVPKERVIEMRGGQKKSLNASIFQGMSW